MSNSKKPYQAMMLAMLRKYGGAVSPAAKELGKKDFKAGVEPDEEKASAKWRKRHYNWNNEDETYRDAYNDLLEDMCDEMEHTLYQGANQREHWPTAVNAANSILKARGKSRGYGTSNQDVTVKGKLNFSAVIEMPSNYSDIGQDNPLPKPWEQE